MTSVLAVANQKGGVQKTTTAVNVSAFMANPIFPLYNQPNRFTPLKVLIIDLDPQGHVTLSFNKTKNDGLYRWAVRGEPLEKVFIQIDKNLYAVSNDQTSVLVEEHINRETFREFFLDNLLKTVKGFDLICLDLAPSNNLIHNLALIAADYVIIPSNLDYLALDGVIHILRTIASLSMHPYVDAPTILGVLPTLFDLKTNESLLNLAELQKVVGPDLILPFIPRDTKAREASSHGQSIWDYAPKSRAAIGIKGYSKITNSLGRTGGYLHLCEIMANRLKLS